MSDPTTTLSYIKWLRDLAKRGGKGVVNNIDARALGRVADRLAEVPQRGLEDMCQDRIVQYCFGIPVHHWIDILEAVHVDIEKAEAKCGGDGAGCSSSRYYPNADGEHRYIKCPSCPMSVLSGVKEALDAALQADSM